MKSIKNRNASRSSRLNKNRKTKYASTPPTVQKGGGDYFNRKLKEFLISKEDSRSSDIYLNIFDVRIMLLYIWAMNIPVGNFKSHILILIEFKDEDLTLSFNTDNEIKELLLNISNIPIPIQKIKLIPKENKTFENLVNECSLISQDKKTDFIIIFNQYFDTDVKNTSTISILKKSKKNSNNGMQNLKEELIRIFLPIDFDSITSNSNKNNITKLFKGLSLKNSPGLEQHYETPVNRFHNHPSRPTVSGRLHGHFNNNFKEINFLYEDLMSENPRISEQHIYNEPFSITPQKPPRRKPSTLPSTLPSNHTYMQPQDNLGNTLQQSEYVSPVDFPQYATVIRKPPSLPPPLPPKRGSTLIPPSHPPSPFPPGEGIFNSKSGKWKPQPPPRTRKHNRPTQPVKDPLPPIPRPTSRRQLPQLPHHHINASGTMEESKL